MKRLLKIVLLSVLVTGVSGCSCGGLSNGGCGSPFGNIGSNLGASFGSSSLGGSSLGNSQGLLSGLSDGPVRRWLRGDSCDTCSVPSGQTSFDAGFDASCETGLCNAPTGETVFGAPIPSSPFPSSVSVPTPVTTGYAPVYGELPLETTAPTLDAGYLNAPYSSPDVYGGSSVYGGTSDGLVIPPLGN